MQTTTNHKEILFPIADKSMKYEFSCSLKYLKCYSTGCAMMQLNFECLFKIFIFFLILYVLCVSRK